jgi:hypothetical protein
MGGTIKAIIDTRSIISHPIAGVHLPNDCQMVKVKGTATVKTGIGI